MHGLSPKLWVLKPFTIKRGTVHIEKLVIETLKIKDHTIISCTSEGNLVINLEAKRRRLLPCSHCGARSRRHDRLPKRTWDHVPIWGIPVFLVYRPWRVRCPKCGIKREHLPWAEGKSRLTRALVVTLATWAKLLPMETVASLFGVSWNTVYAAVRAAVSFGLAHRTPGIITHIGIDEISRKKGHRYLTQVYNLNTRTLIWSGEGRKESTLRAFFQQYPDVAQTVTAVCCDMWQPYVTVVREFCPNAELVFDKFHIIRHLLDAVDQVRKEEAYEMRKVDPEVLKRTRYVILKNEENLTEKQRLRLKDLQKQKLKSVRAWLLKESFRTFWTSPSPDDARAFLDQWCWMAMHSRLDPIKKVVKMIRSHVDGILAFFKHGITNGVVEALNNTAKAISHRARGYRTVNAFCQIMLLCMGGLNLPTLHHEFV
jgi:transposase